jgi:cytochrome b subunit of formate dehydrogenase
MKPAMYIKRFDVIDRLFHLYLMITFLIQTATGFSRLYYATAWGKGLNAVFGGYDTSLMVHRWVGILMLAGFALHTLRLLAGIRWTDLKTSLLGPDTLIPTHHDFIHLAQRIRWFIGLGPAPKLGRWTYWEKFDYWAVYWGLPLLALTGLMLMYPLWSTRYVPGWMLNVAALLHRAEAILAVTYIFIVHFFIGHLRPSSFPMNEAMFSGSVPIEEAMEEKSAWMDRLKQEGKIVQATVNPPAVWYRVVYFAFGYLALGFGIYLLVNGIAYSRYITLH